MAKNRTSPTPTADPTTTQEAQKQPESAESKPADGGNVETKAEQLPPATETVRVKFLRSHPALAYSPGEEADLPQALHDKYLADGPFFEKI